LYWCGIIRNLYLLKLFFFQITNPALIDVIKRKVKLNQPYVGVFLKAKEEYVSCFSCNVELWFTDLKIYILV